MPNRTVINLSELTVEQLREELELLREEKEKLLRYLAQAEADISIVEEELKKR